MKDVRKRTHFANMFVEPSLSRDFEEQNPKSRSQIFTLEKKSKEKVCSCSFGYLWDSSTPKEDGSGSKLSRWNLNLKAEKI